jgi:hypothetical protein
MDLLGWSLVILNGEEILCHKMPKKCPYMYLSYGYVIISVF